MESVTKYICAVGRMFVKSLNPDVLYDGEIMIRNIKKCILIDDQESAMKFDNRNYAKSVANKTGGVVIKIQNFPRKTKILL